jgi:hypothetical protein
MRSQCAPATNQEGGRAGFLSCLEIVRALTVIGDVEALAFGVSRVP